MIKIVSTVLIFLFNIGSFFNPAVLSTMQIFEAANKTDNNLTKIQTLLNEEFLVFYKNEVSDWNNPKIIQDIAFKKVLESVNWLTFFDYLKADWKVASNLSNNGYKLELNKNKVTLYYMYKEKDLITLEFKILNVSFAEMITSFNKTLSKLSFNFLYEKDKWDSPHWVEQQANFIYKDVVDVLNKYVKLRCKKNNLDLVKIELNEQDVPLDEGANVIKIKLKLNDQSLETTVSLEHVKKPNIEEQKANLLATKLMNETHNFSYNDFNETNTVNDIANKIKQIYQKDLVVGYFDNIVFDQDNTTILPTTKLKWGENIIPLVVRYNNKSTKINLKVNLMNQKQFSEYEVNRVIDEILLNSETINSIFTVEPTSGSPVYRYFYAFVNELNAFLNDKTQVRVEKADSQEDQVTVWKSTPFEIKFKVFLNDYNKEVKITVTK